MSPRMIYEILLAPERMAELVLPLGAATSIESVQID
jgi:hypothetical protein